MKERSSILPEPGQRAIIIGSTGSGKTGFGTWLLLRLPFSPILIFDTKDEEKFPLLPDSTVCTSWDETIQAMNNEAFDYVTFRPPTDELSDPDALDEYLYDAYESFEHIGVMVDELLSFVRSSRPGPGLTALLTRGRSRGITTILATQRPAGIPRFALTEAQRFYIFNLTHEDDRKTTGRFVPGLTGLAAPRDYGFYYYQVGDQAPRLYKRVKLDPGMDTGYTGRASVASRQAPPAPTWVDRYNWI